MHIDSCIHTFLGHREGLPQSGVSGYGTLQTNHRPRFAIGSAPLPTGAHRQYCAAVCSSLLQCVAVCWLLESQTEVCSWCSAISRRYTLLRMYGALLRICRALFRMYRALLVGYAGLCGRFVGLGLGRRSVLLHCPQVHIVKSVLQCIVVCCSVLGTRIDGLQ